MRVRAIGGFVMLVVSGSPSSCVIDAHLHECRLGAERKKEKKARMRDDGRYTDENFREGA